MRRLRFVVGALLAVCWIAPLSAQQGTGTISGRVTDASTKQPIAGAMVTYGTHNTQASADGNYVLAGIAPGTDTLHVKMIGYAPHAEAVTVTAGQISVVNVAMTQRAVTLSQIVVVGYGQQRAGDVTGSVKQINSADFNKGQIVSPQALIQSKVAGVQVIDNNAPGGGLSVRIRGTTSVNASSEPIYVVDGVVLAPGGGLSTTGDPLNFLNSDDIASITVLKDAAAASIYGANAANGVVLITTKTGHGAPHITYSTSVSASSVTRVPSVLNASQFAAAVAQYAPSRVSMLGSANTDWFNQVEQTGWGQQQNIAIAGSGNENSYRLSLGYLKQNGIIKNNSTQRLSVGLNFDQRLLNDDLQLRANVAGSRTFEQQVPGDVLGNAVTMAPTQPVVDSTSASGYWDWNTSGAAPSNPVASNNLSDNHGITWRSVGNVQGDYKLPFLRALRVHVNLGYDFTQADYEGFAPSILADQSRALHGQLNLSNSSQMNQLLEVYGEYEAPLSPHAGRITLQGGYAYSKSHAEYPSFSETNLASDLLGTNGVPGSSQPPVVNKTVTDSKLISFFGRMNYNLNDEYLLSALVRRDGSSKFGPSNAWGVFPAFSAAWRISKEPFLSGISALSDLKLRASWGKTGNEAFADYQQYPTFTYSNTQAQYQFGNQFITTIRPSAVDPNIKWEATTTTDFGADFALFGSRVSGSFDWYRKNTSGLIFTVPVAAGTNFSNYLTTNIGSMRNQGVELALNTALFQSSERGGFNWEADFTASHNSNELTSITSTGSQLIQVGGIAGGVGSTIQVLEPGVPVNSFYVCPQAYDGSGKPIEGQYIDTTGATVNACDASALRPYHNPAPSWILGHTSSMTMGSFDLSFTLRAYLGNYVYNNVASANGAYQNTTNGGAPANMSSSVLQTGFVVPQFTSDIYVESGSFLRMDNITLGYSFHLQGAPTRVFVTVQNAFTITGYSGVDPTAGVNGIDNNIYPRSRTVTGGLRVQF